MNEQEFTQALHALAKDRKKTTVCALIKKMGYRRGRKLLEREIKKIPEIKEFKKQAPGQVDNIKDKAKAAGPEIVKEITVSQKEKEQVKPFRKDRKLYLREEFPFLSEDDCPDILKILVSNMLTAHDKYVKGHQQLFDVAHKDNETCFEAASQVVDNYIENRKIWAELDHYARTKTLLGEHPLFEIQRKKEQMISMSEEELRKQSESIRKKIWKRVDMIKNNPDDPRLEKWRSDLKQFEAEQQELDRRRQGTLQKKRGRKPKAN